MSTGARLWILAGIIVVAIAVLVIAGGGGDDGTTTSTATTPATSASESTTTTQATPARPPAYTVTVKDAKPVGGVKKIEAKKGDPVTFVVKSDTADEIHLHGYDLKKDVTAGGTARFNFEAKIDGNFEIELEHHGVQIAELTVQP